MQLSICCSSRAVGLAGRLATRLKRNLGIETLIIAEDSAAVSETWEEGAGAQAILILLDSVSAPAPLRREAWKELINHDGDPPIAFVRIDDCAYPKLLERGRFFPSTEPELDRAVDRWLIRLLPAHPGIEPAELDAPFPADWWTALIDQPGEAVTDSPSAAHAFARKVHGHFQGVIWIGCAGREPALIRAELDHRLREGRMLVVLAHLEKPLTLPESRHSVVHLMGAPPQSAESGPLGACYAPLFPGWLARELGADLSAALLLDARDGLYRMDVQPVANESARQWHLEILDRYFQRWKADPEACRQLLAEVPAALDHAFAHDWPRGSALCRRAAFLLLSDGRRREGTRLMHRLWLEAETHGDAETAEEALHELSWLTGEEDSVRPETVSGEQLALDLFS